MTMYLCHDCKRIIEHNGVKYCLFCGSKNVKCFNLSNSIPQDKVVLIVKETSSKTVQNVLCLMQKMPGYFEFGSVKLKYCGVAYDFGSELMACEIIQECYPYVKYLLYEKGKKRTSATFLLEPYQCVKQRKASADPFGHCYFLDGYPNIVGCRHMGLSLPSYNYLHFSGDYEDVFGNFVYDKSYMEKKVINIAKRYRYCPYLCPDLALRFVKAWPDRVNVYLDKRFRELPKGYYNFGSISLNDYEIDEVGMVHKKEAVNEPLRGDKPAKIMPPIPIAYSFYKDLLKEVFLDSTGNSVVLPAEKAIAKVLESVKHLI